MKRTLLAVALLAAVGAAQAAAVEKMQRFLDTTRTLRAEFTQTVVGKSGKAPQTSSGTMLISRPGKFAWLIDKPYKQQLVGDGEKVWMYDPDLRQVTVRKFDAALGSTPAALLVGAPDGRGGGRSALESRFTLREAGTRDGFEWLEATPKTPDSGFERLLIGFAGDELKAMELFDNFGQTTRLVFGRSERNPALAPTLFKFTPPSGVDVIGE